MTWALLIIAASALLGATKPNPRASTFLPLLFVAMAGMAIGYLTLPSS